MADETLGYSQEVLEETPSRVAKFLQGIGSMPVIRTLLAGAGMNDEHIAEGRTLLLACLAAPRGAAPARDTTDAQAQRAAVAELDQWDEPNFARFGAALRRRFADAHAYVFADGLKASSGAQAVTGVATFLLRLDMLEKGSDPARATHKKQDAAAVALLAERGLTHEERKRLKKLVDVALGPTTPLDAADDGGETPRLRKLAELRGWFDEWSETARAVIKKRGYLIRLGLAARKSPKADAPEEPPPAGSPPAKS